ncbi:MULTISPECIES: molybdopterin-dependent oxidoreductase [Burkholderia]|uniref:molybdopterin-dependent oxidoreductase n=1 Tax=Burkholderia TaxID=32008 RepID=UPI000BF5A9C4|nr:MULTISPECIES: molybdopterin-dependent oxidoreductase [Burkholderia]PFH20992.1 hypothetical protein BX604_5417 [Burkholderia sp. JKS000303]
MASYRTCIVTCAALFLGSAVHAHDAPLSLEVSGDIASVDSVGRHDYVFSSRELHAMRAYAITTSTNWTPVRKWVGPRLTDVLNRVGASGTRIRVIAFDDYSQVIPMAFIEKHQPVLAYEADGKPLKLEDFGPLFLIFPRDADPEALTSISNTRRFVFEVRSIEVQ